MINMKRKPRHQRYLLIMKIQYNYPKGVKTEIKVKTFRKRKDAECLEKSMKDIDLNNTIETKLKNKYDETKTPKIF